MARASSPSPLGPFGDDLVLLRELLPREGLLRELLPREGLLRELLPREGLLRELLPRVRALRGPCATAGRRLRGGGALRLDLLLSHPVFLLAPRAWCPATRG